MVKRLVIEVARHWAIPTRGSDQEQAKS
jgi:hypothetical protein